LQDPGIVIHAMNDYHSRHEWKCAPPLCLTRAR
jgi:hypothetical protein